jgi:Fe-Mn family superoxide dismutase
MFETAFLGDKYGVWDKKKYAGDWWKALDWQRIQARNALGR